MITSIFLQARHRDFNTNCPISSKPTLILTSEAFSASSLKVFRAEGDPWLFIDEFQNAPIEYLTGFHTDMCLAPFALFLIYNYFDGPFFKFHYLNLP
jgi:hypothetical protein